MPPLSTPIDSRSDALPFVTPTLSEGEIGKAIGDFRGQYKEIILFNERIPPSPFRYMVSVAHPEFGPIYKISIEKLRRIVETLLINFQDKQPTDTGIISRLQKYSKRSVLSIPRLYSHFRFIQNAQDLLDFSIAFWMHLNRSRLAGEIGGNWEIRKGGKVNLEDCLSAKRVSNCLDMAVLTQYLWRLFEVESDIHHQHTLHYYGVAKHGAVIDLPKFDPVSLSSKSRLTYPNEQEFISADNWEWH